MAVVQQLPTGSALKQVRGSHRVSCAAGGLDTGFDSGPAGLNLRLVDSGFDVNDRT